MAVVETLCPGTELFKYDLGCGVLEQDDFTMLQGKVEFTDNYMYCPHETHTGGWHLLM